MKRCLLDSSFVIDLFNEVAANRRGPAHAWISRNSGADLWVSPVTYAEVLEGAFRFSSRARGLSLVSLADDR